jgi:hypothetical protein
VRAARDGDEVDRDERDEDDEGDGPRHQRDVHRGSRASEDGPEVFSAPPGGGTGSAGPVLGRDVMTTLPRKEYSPRVRPD